jgi:hypothetical protein
MDIFNPDLSLLAPVESFGLNPTSFFVPSLGRTVFCTTDLKRDARPQTQRITFRYQWFDENGQDHHEINSFLMTAIFPRELQLLLERHGFEILKIYGDYDGSKASNDSPRQIAWCRLGRRVGKR